MFAKNQLDFKNILPRLGSFTPLNTGIENDVQQVRCMRGANRKDASFTGMISTMHNGNRFLELRRVRLESFLLTFEDVVVVQIN